MPRPLRIEYPGARYHVMCRGNRGAVVFGSKADSALFLETLEEAVERTDWRIHAYVLMRTHYHLLLETPSANLVAGMKWLQGSFTQRMNARHKTWGHLFQGRYKAKIIDDTDPAYFRQVADYIHLNPAAAGVLKPKTAPELAGYTDGSYPHYLKPPGRRPDWLEVQAVLAGHGLRDTPKGRRAFEALMQLKALQAMKAGAKFYAKAEWKGMERGWVHGEENFRARMLEYLHDHRIDKAERVYDAQQKRDLTEAAICRTMEIGLAQLGVTKKALPELKRSHAVKILLAAYIKHHYSIENAWISHELHMGHPSLVGKCGRLIAETTALQKAYKKLETGMGRA